MPCTSAMKTTARLSASSMEQSTEQPMADKHGFHRTLRQPVFSEYTLSMPILGPSSAMTVSFLGRPTEDKTGLRKLAEQPTSFERCPLLIRTLGLFLVVILIRESALFLGQQMEGKLG